MQEIIKSIKAYLYERSTSPLMGSFVVSWLVWNYRFVVVLVSSADVDSKFRTIDLLFGLIEFDVFGHTIDLSGSLVRGFIGPAVTAMVYLYFYPILAKPVYEYSLARQKGLREVKQAIENQRLLSLEESREMYTKVARLQELLERESEGHRKQVSALTATINNLEGHLRAATPALSSPAVLLLGRPIAEVKLAIEGLTQREFGLEELFDAKEWGDASPTARKDAGRAFMKLVEAGAFPGVESKGKTSGKMIYVKAAGAGLSAKEEGLLAEFEGLDEDRGWTADDLQPALEWHIDQVRASADDLVLKGLLQRLKTEDEKSLYMLTHLGRKYLVENRLLGSGKTLLVQEGQRPATEAQQPF